jgi:tripartite-type tricarboxylate transporter receptor subunit TctC
LLVGFPPGGNADASARLVAHRMSESLGANMVVENRGGAGGSIAAQIASRAAPDGYTVLWSSPGGLVMNRILDAKPAYNAEVVFSPVGRTFTFYNVLIVRNDSPLTTVAQLVAAAREKAGFLQIGSQGMGSAGHLSGEMLQKFGAIRLSHVPFKGATEVLTAVAGGEIAMAFVSTLAATSMRTRVRALAVTGPQRDPALAEVPTLQEAGIKGYDATFWFGVMVPVGTPAPIVTRLNQELRNALGDAEIARYARTQGLNPAPSSPRELGDVIKNDYERWKNVMGKS